MKRSNRAAHNEKARKRKKLDVAAVIDESGSAYCLACMIVRQAISVYTTVSHQEFPNRDERVATLGFVAGLMQVTAEVASFYNIEFDHELFTTEKFVEIAREHFEQDLAPEAGNRPSHMVH